jgi:serine/threonine protein kinase, bacterial
VGNVARCEGIEVFTTSYVDETPEEYLRSTATVFAMFDQQDSGNISYGVRTGHRRYFVKTAGRPSDQAPPQRHDQRVELLRNAVRLAQSYPHPALPHLHRVIESPHGPMLVYDWAPGELLYVPHPERSFQTSAYQRFRALPAEQVMVCLDTIIDVHDLLGRSGEVAGDFYDGCLIYDFATYRVSLVDLDNYRSGQYHNEVGRLFGSTRFMAPEEFTKGALIDQRTSVFAMGRTVLVLLSDATADPQGFRGPPSLLRVATQACQPRPEDRFRDLPQFCAAWRAARAEATSSSGT